MSWTLIFVTWCIYFHEVISIILFAIIFAPSSLLQQFISGMGFLTDGDTSRETGVETEDDDDVQHNDENNIETENKEEEFSESSV